MSIASRVARCARALIPAARALALLLLLAMALLLPAPILARLRLEPPERRNRVAEARRRR